MPIERPLLEISPECKHSVTIPTNHLHQQAQPTILGLSKGRCGHFSTHPPTIAFLIVSSLLSFTFARPRPLISSSSSSKSPGRRQRRSRNFHSSKALIDCPNNSNGNYVGPNLFVKKLLSFLLISSRILPLRRYRLLIDDHGVVYNSKASYGGPCASP